MSAGYLTRLNTRAEVTICISESHLRPPKNKSKSKSSQRDEKISEITSAICALFNSSRGGLLTLIFDEKCKAIKAAEPKSIDDLVRRIEQSALNFVGVATVSSAFKLQEGPENDGLVFTVKPVSRF